MKLQRMLLAIAISSGLTLATVSHAQHRHWWRTPAPADTTAPTTPTGLSASAITTTSVILSWGAATDNVGVTGYRVYVNGTLVVSSSSTSVQITDLTPGFTRSFTVSAVDAAGNVSAPAAPTGLAASALTLTSLTLSWSPATDNVGVTGYRVYRDGTLVASPSGTSVSITGLLAGTLYSFTVSAFDAAGNVSAPSAALPVTTLLLPPPPYDPQVQWQAGMETGDLGQWTEKVNTGYADSVAVTAASAGIPAHSGAWVMKQSVIRPSGVVEASGTRMARYPEIDALAKAGTTFYYSWWDFFPTALSYNTSGWYNHWQIASNDASNTGTPVWALAISGSGNTMVLAWGPNGSVPVQGPHAGESGDRAYTSPIAIPVGQWVFFEVMITPRGDFTGALKVWMNGQVLFDLSNVKTQFPYAGQGLLTWITNNNYGTGLTPTPFVHYVDDVTISHGRIGYP